MPALMSKTMLVICMFIALGEMVQGAPILDDLFHGFVRDSQLANEPAKPVNIVKRRIYTDNPDARLKQISLQSLIGDVEDSLYNTALSVSSVAHNHDAIVPEVTPNASGDGSESADERAAAITKRETEQELGTLATTTATNGQLFTTEATPESKNIFLQTTQKVPAANGVPAHILIDRVAVQQHEGGLPFIPAFQVYHTKVISATFKEPANPTSSAVDGTSSSSSSSGNNGAAENGNGGVKSTKTKISIAQTAVQSSNAAGAAQFPVITITTGATNPSTLTLNAETPATTAADESLPATSTTGTLDASKTTATTIQLQNVQLKGSEETAAATTTTTTATASSDETTATTTASLPLSTTTKLPITQLKEAEEELKEKVAEIEAEPIILSARV